MKESKAASSIEAATIPGRRDPAIRVMLLPRDTNAVGTIFGGIILSYIDQAGAVEAHRWVSGPVVTVAMRAVEFHEPVFVGDLVSLYTRTLRLGRTSITVKVEVEAERRCQSCENRDGEAVQSGEVVKVTEAEVVYVHVDERRNPIPLDLAPSDSGYTDGRDQT